MVYFNPSNADIANLYLYGTSTTPSDLSDDSLLRPTGATTTIQVNKAALMAGAERFALGSQSLLVRDFFNLNGQLAAGSYTKQRMIALLGLGSSNLTIQVYQNE